jgi:hypothetical protein
MSAGAPSRSSLLRWYPPAWRDRYGEEFLALMEDSLDGRPLSHRLRLSVAWAGLRERAHQAGLMGDSIPAADRARAGALVVLWAWTAFVLAGTSFQRLSEHFQQAVPAGARALPVVAFGTVFVAAVVGGLLVLSGTAIAVPAFVSFVRAGGWPCVRRHFVRAAGATALAGVALVALVAVAHTLSPAQRNGARLYHPAVWYYLVQYVVTGLVVAGMLALWTVAAVAAARHLGLARTVLRAEAVMAVAVMTAMTVMTVATAVWWVAISSSAPWFLAGAPIGAAASAFDPVLAATMFLMVAATVVAAYGATRITRSWRDMHTT